MTLTLVTLTADPVTLVGADPTSAVRFTVRTNTGGAIIDAVGNKLYLGTHSVTLKGTDTFSATLPPTNGATNPTAFQYAVDVEYVDAATKKRTTWSSGWFSLTTSKDLAAVAAEQYVPPTWMTTATATLQGYVDQGHDLLTQQQAISGLTGEDTAIASRINDSTSATRAALNSSLVPKWQPLTPYVTGDIRMAPDGSLVERTSDGTSGSTYSGTNWKAATGLAAQIATKVGTEATDQASALRVALYNQWFVRDDALAMNGRDLADVGDSFGQVLSGITPFPNLINTVRGGVLANLSVSGSYWRDVTTRAINGVTPGIAADNFIIAHSGINPAYFQGIGNAISRQAERDAFEMLLWILASSTKIENTAWTETGAGWSAYSHTKLSGGGGRITSTDGNYAEITPAAGDYVGMGFTFRAGDPSGGHQLGIASETGTWAKDGAAVNTFTKDAPWWTNLESQDSASEFGPSAGNLVPRPIRLLGLSGANVIRQTRTASSGAGYTIRDAMWKLSATPPWIVVLKPTYPASSWQSAGTNGSYGTTAGASIANVDAYRRDIDSVVASVTAAYAPLRGKIIVVDPVASGWDASVHASSPSDGLHPNATGHAFLAALIQREVAFAVRMRRQLIATGQIAVA